MLVQKKIGNLDSHATDKIIDLLELQWHETGKRIMHKRTKSGREVVIKFMNEAQSLTEGDILWEDETGIIAVEVQPCEAIIIRPSSMFQMASVCYEIGNKHLPLFYDKEELIVPFEAPLFKLLSAAGYEPKREIRKLVNQLKSTVSPHGHADNRQSLFSKILQLTTSPADV